MEIITYTGKDHLYFKGKKHLIDYIPIMSVGELKQVILSIDNTVPDFDFLYCGRMIRSNDKILGDFINTDNLKLYTNAKGVHGGCFKVSNGCG